MPNMDVDPPQKKGQRKEGDDDMDVDQPPTDKKVKKEDNGEGKKRFEVKKVKSPDS
jgi:hypothetical protein